MLNLIKYELRKKYLTMLGICITVIMGNLFLMIKIGSGGTGVAILSTVLAIGALVAIFISSLTLMSDYLYDDQGYLLFTLPQSGVSITASRLIAAVIQISIVTIVSVLMFCLIDQGRMLNIILSDSKLPELLYSILMYIWTIVFTLILIYFCMVVGKIALKGKKIGKIGSFIIFILLNIALSGLTAIISNFFPQIVQFNALATITINIGSTIFDMITCVLLFMATSYLLENKVDL
jgi:ABC-2 type transport system permease protein